LSTVLVGYRLTAVPNVDLEEKRCEAALALAGELWQGRQVRHRR
jgi:hypothetical protein